MIRPQTLEVIKDKLQQVIDRGARSVEQLHLHAVDLRYDVLGRVGLAKGDSQRDRERAHRGVHETYDAIRRLNQQLGELLGEQIQARARGQHMSEVVEQSYAASRAGTAATAATDEAAGAARAKPSGARKPASRAGKTAKAAAAPERGGNGAGQKTAARKTAARRGGKRGKNGEG